MCACVRVCVCVRVHVCVCVCVCVCVQTFLSLLGLPLFFADSAGGGSREFFLGVATK